MKSNLQDPQKLLQGSGSLVRFIPLDSPAQIDSTAVQRLMKHALVAAKVPLCRTGKGKLIIKSISARHPHAVHRPRNRRATKARVEIMRGIIARAILRDGATEELR